MEIRVYVILRKNGRYMLRWTEPGTRRLHDRDLEKGISRKEAERLAGQLSAELVEGRYAPPSRITWKDFRKRYEKEKLASLAKRTSEPAKAVFNHVDRILRPNKLADLTATSLSVLQTGLRTEGLAETTIAGHLAHLRSAMRWAKRIGLLSMVPEFEMPKRVKGKSAMRGYPIAGEQFERMLAAAAKVRPKDAEVWRFFLRGLWLSGLRLGESLVLSWDRDATISIDLTGRHPRMRIDAEAEKGNKHRLLPITPDFAELLLAVPVLERLGRVFKLDGLETHEPISLKRVGRIVSAIGKKAGVVVNRDAKPYKRPGKPRKGKPAKVVEVAAHPGKFGSAHDLRRAFGTRWASKVKPATLRALMRHESIETTLKYYVALDADDVADELWKEHDKKNAASDKPKIDA